MKQSCNAEYISDTKKNVMTRRTEHQQDIMKRRWQSSSVKKHCLNCNSRFIWLHQKTISRETRYKGSPPR